jgi:hypothetical protein
MTDHPGSMKFEFQFAVKIEPKGVSLRASPRGFSRKEWLKIARVVSISSILSNRSSLVTHYLVNIGLYHL